MERFEVTRRCKRTVPSAVPVQPGMFHRLSAFDQAMEPNTSLRVVFYYPQFPSASVSSCGADGTTKCSGMNVTSPVGLIRDSLSRVLSSFPVATGRLLRSTEGRGGWMVKCNDAGVRVIEATARGSVEEWVSDRGKTQGRQRERDLVFWEDMYDDCPHFWSTFYVQLTEFEGGGLAIGVSCSHMLADAASLTMLVKAWADMNLLGKILCPPNFRALLVSSPEPSNGLQLGRTNVDGHRPSLLAEAADNHSAVFSTATFFFSDGTVRAIVDDSRPADGGVGATAFQALAALFWTSISRVKGSRQGLVDISLCLDAREAVGLSKTFFGNAMVYVDVPGGSVAQGRLDAAARAVAVAASESKEGDLVWKVMEWLEAEGETGGPEHSDKRIRPCGPPRRLLLANWESLGPYAATFEPGIRPIGVSYYLEPVEGGGQVMVLPHARGHAGSAGRAVKVTLPHEQLLALYGDASIRRYQQQVETTVMGS